jgi:hypothetical protein
MWVAADFSGMPAGHGLARFADVPYCQRRDGPPELVIRREYSVIAVPVLPRRRDEIHHTVELTFRRQCHPWPLPPWAVVAKAEVWLDRRAGILPANGVSSTTPVSPGRVDFRQRPGPTECAPNHAKPRSHDTSRIAWAKLLARVGEEFPLECPACGGDIRLIAFITDPGPIHATAAGRSRLPSNRRFASGQWPRWHCLREAVPPPVSPARGPPTDWGEFVQVHHDRDVLQSSPDELPVIDIHSL